MAKHRVTCLVLQNVAYIPSILKTCDPYLALSGIVSRTLRACASLPFALKMVKISWRGVPQRYSEDLACVLLYGKCCTLPTKCFICSWLMAYPFFAPPIIDCHNLKLKSERADKARPCCEMTCKVDLSRRNSRVIRLTLSRQIFPSHHL